MVICGYMGYRFSIEGDPPFSIIGFVPQGLPEFKLPPFGYVEVVNGTEIQNSTAEMITNIGSGVFVIALIALLENIAVCKAFCKCISQLLKTWDNVTAFHKFKKIYIQFEIEFYFCVILANGKPIDATQEFIAVGLCNIGNSFVQSFPINGPLARGAVNNASGVRTTLAGLYAGGLVIISLLFFTPYFRYIPRATLAGVIIAAVIFMVEVKVVKPMWRTKSKCFYNYNNNYNFFWIQNK